jgi:cell surface protein SprA
MQAAKKEQERVQHAAVRRAAVQARGGKSGGSQIGLLKMLDPGNFTGNFSYIESFNRDVNTEFRLNREYRGGLNYNFSHSPKNFKPFGKIGFLRKLEFMKWLTDFNFYLGLEAVYRWFSNESHL